MKIRLRNFICPTSQSNVNFSYIKHMDNFEKSEREEIRKSEYNICPLCFLSLKRDNNISNKEARLILEVLSKHTDKHLIDYEAYAILKKEGYDVY